VDDEALIPPMLADYLGRYNHSVRMARSSVGALGWLDVESFDVVVLDVMMAGPMDGLDVCRRMRSDPKTAQVRVLIISGVPDMECRAYSAGADAFLPKPFDLVDIMASVSHLVSLRRPGASAKPGFTVRSAIETYNGTMVS
ncbi:MAG TPA: response regulator, partial [Blastocatellia bacterium]|nr:response regulator [Blastocatellia bacterium]